MSKLLELTGANLGGAKLLSSESSESSSSLSLELSSLSSMVSSVVVLSPRGCSSGGNRSENLERVGALMSLGSAWGGPNAGGPKRPTLVRFLTLLLGGLPRAIRQSSQSQTLGRFSGGGDKHE